MRNKDADSREGGHLCRHPVSADINGPIWYSKCEEKKKRKGKEKVSGEEEEKGKRINK